jgi:hypothetical protein
MGIESQLPLRNFFAALVSINHNTLSLENFNGDTRTFCTEKISNMLFCAANNNSHETTLRALYGSIQNYALAPYATERFSSFGLSSVSPNFADTASEGTQ